MGLKAPVGHVTWISVTTQPLQQEEDGWSVVTSVTDITDRRHAQVELQRLADHDSLTGLLNRRRLEADLTALAQAGDAKDCGAVIVLDLDNFKHVNDSLGHAVGDELICSTATAIARRLRASDTVARLGGDEFAVIAPTPGRREALARRSLLAVIREEVVVMTVDGPRRTTASAGIAMMEIGPHQREVLAPRRHGHVRGQGAGQGRHGGFDPGADRRAGRGRAAVGRADPFRPRARRISSMRSRSWRWTRPTPSRYELLVRMRSDDGETVPPGSSCPSPSAST